MKVHVVCTGTELLIGHTLNTNLHFMGQVFNAEGYAIGRERCVPDTPAAIGAAVAAELHEADVVITVGGLGPTSDDLTREAVARELGVGLHLDEQVLAAIVEFLGERSRQLPAEALKTQAMVPAGATPLPNRNGTAPGLWCPTADGKVVIMLPGPPRELQPMFTQEVLPRLRKRASPDVARTSFTVAGLPESVVAEKVERFLAEFPGFEPAYCARPAVVDVRLSAFPAHATQLRAATDELAARFGTAVLPTDCPSLAAAVGALLCRHGLWLATAESCTGGGIAGDITDLPGASAFFLGGIVSYSNDWKTTLLDVPDETLSTHGAVSAETAIAMLNALFRRYEVDAGIAVTGIAGPGGGTPEKPVGLVFIASGIRGKLNVQRCLFPGNRESVRTRAVNTALNQLRLQLLEFRS